MKTSDVEVSLTTRTQKVITITLPYDRVVGANGVVLNHMSLGSVVHEAIVQAVLDAEEAQEEEQDVPF